MSPRDWSWFLAGVLVTVAVRMFLFSSPDSIASAPDIGQGIQASQATQTAPAATENAPTSQAALAFEAASTTEAASTAQATSTTQAASMTQAASATQATSMAQAASATRATSVTQAAMTAHATQGTTSAGSMDEVTQRLAKRLATAGGSESEWMLLAQSYDYLGRTADAAAARSHIANAVLSQAAAGPLGAALDSETMAAVASALDK